MSDLPVISLHASGDVLTGKGEQWSIRAEREGRCSARTAVKVGGVLVADVTIHAGHQDDLSDEVQAVAAALVWSALRAINAREGGA